MNDNFISGQYDVTKKSKLRQFYDGNKKLIFSISFILIIIIASLNIYSYLEEQKKIELSEKYINAKINLENDNKVEAINLLYNIIYSNDSTYSTLSLFEIVDRNVETNDEKIINLFEHVLENNKFDDEIKNLIILKKAIFETNFADEQKMLETIKPLINEDTVWKAHALLLAGNYYFSKGEKIKAKDFFSQILNIENLNKELLDQANHQLRLIIND